LSQVAAVVEVLVSQVAVAQVECSQARWKLLESLTLSSAQVVVSVVQEATRH
jgi:hypothetical protein